VTIWRKFVVGMACLALTPSMFAAEKAILNNGFEIRHANREQIGATTRLYLSEDRTSGYVDVTTADIASFEHDDLPVLPPEPAPAAGTSQTPGNRASYRTAKGGNSQADQGALTASARQIDFPALVNQASDQHLVDADLISSVIKAESGFNHRAVSPKGAQGLMQLMPGTAGKLGVKDAFDPADNVDGGTRYLRELLLRYNNDMVKAVAAYNAGPERVDQYHGVPPYRETHDYVVRVIKEYNRKKGPVKPSAMQKSVRRASASQRTATAQDRKKTVNSAAKQSEASKM
jgi:hypothetical protein